MARQSAGLLLFRRSSRGAEVLFVHPGGPLWARRDAGAWSIPKGEFQQGEDPLVAARREFEEETGQRPAGRAIPVGALRQPGGKTVHAWAVEGDCDPGLLPSNTFSMEWPPRSGRFQDFPEVDRAAWFSLEEARPRILKGQIGFLDRLRAILESRPGAGRPDGARDG